MATPPTSNGPKDTPSASSTSGLPCVRRRWSDLAKAAVAGGVLAGTGALAHRSLPGWEKDLFETLHQVPRAYDYVLWTPMQFGSAWAPVLAAVAGWYVSKSWRPVAGSLVVGWGGWWLAKAVKNEIDRGRPFAELGAQGVRPTAVTEGLGFVSGHATVAFACAAVLSPYLGRPWRIGAYTLAGLVALSRVVVGAHFPLDVVGGAALGLMLAYLWHIAAGVQQTESC